MGAYINDIYQDEIFVELSVFEKLFLQESKIEFNELSERLKSLGPVQVVEKRQKDTLGTIYFAKVLSVYGADKEGKNGAVLRLEVKHSTSTYNFRVMKDPFGMKTVKKIGTTYRSKYRQKITKERFLDQSSS